MVHIQRARMALENHLFVAQEVTVQKKYIKRTWMKTGITLQLKKKKMCHSLHRDQNMLVEVEIQVVLMKEGYMRNSSNSVKYQ